MDNRRLGPSRHQALRAVAIFTEILGQPQRVGEALRILHQVHREAKTPKSPHSRVG